MEDITVNDEGKEGRMDTLKASFIGKFFHRNENRLIAISFDIIQDQ